MSELQDMVQKVLSSPEDMSRIMQLAQSLSGGQSEETQSSANDAATLFNDPELSGLLNGLMQGLSGSTSNEKNALITALKPYLREERRSKIDRAMKIAKIAKITGSALGAMGGSHDI